MGNYNCDYELYHHGVKGQKWGVRRKRNADEPKAPANGNRQSWREKKESVARGRKLYKQLNKQRKIDWDEDKNAELIEQITRKDWDDIQTYRHNRSVENAVTMAVVGLGGLTLAAWALKPKPAWVIEYLTS